MTQSTDQRQVVHNYSFDSAGRLSFDAVTLTAGTAATNVASAILGIGRTYDDLGRIQNVTSYAGTTTASTVVNDVKYTYDGWGNVIKSQQEHSGAVGTNTAAVQYAYDDGLPSGSTNTAGLFVRLSKVTYPGGRQVYYNYGSTGGIGDSLNRVDNITSAASSGTVYANYSYVGTGRLIRIGHPAALGTSGDQLVLSYGTAGDYPSLDRFGRVINQDWVDDESVGSPPLTAHSYWYDRGGNVIAKASDSIPGDGFDETYAYDGLDRLSLVQRGTLSGTNVVSMTFSQDWGGGAAATNGAAVDSLGNWRNYDNDGTTQSRTANAANETTGISGGSWIVPTYDAAGNMISGPKADAPTVRLWYTYDAWNRLVTVKNDNSGAPGTTLATYAYDGQNRRVSKTTGGHTDGSYFNEDWQVLEVRRNGDTDAREQFIWDQSYIDSPIVRFLDANTDGDYSDVGDSTLYYTFDANHNVTSAIDASTGTTSEYYVYDPYGKVTMFDGNANQTSGSAVEADVLFGGYTYDAETGMDCVRNRNYHPLLGEWLSRDPVNYVDGADLYQYVESSPTHDLDPTGLLTSSQMPTNPGDPLFNAGDLTKTNPPQFQDQLKWLIAIPAGLVHYTFTWQDFECNDCGRESTEITKQGGDPTFNHGKGMLAPGEGVGSSEYWLYNGAGTNFSILNAGFGATGEQHYNGPVQDAGGKFNDENTSSGHHGWFKVDVEVYSFDGSDKKSVKSLGNEYAQSGFNNVNRNYFDFGIDSFHMANGNKTPGNIAKRNLIAWYTAEAEWDGCSTPGTYEYSWETWSAAGTRSGVKSGQLST